VRLSVKVKPRSSRPGVELAGDGTAQVKVSASPVDGKANSEVCKLLAAHYGVAKSKVKIVSGGKSRNKLIEIED